jgi:DNA-binding protein H-NS
LPVAVKGSWFGRQSKESGGVDVIERAPKGTPKTAFPSKDLLGALYVPLRASRSQPRSTPGVVSRGIYGVTMKQLGSMNFDELLALKQKVEAALASRVGQERKRLTDSLRRLDSLALPGAHSRKWSAANGHSKSRTLAVKYRNPANSKETWAGRGNKPRWLVAALKGGKKKLADFAVS